MRGWTGDSRMTVPALAMIAAMLLSAAGAHAGTDETTDNAAKADATTFVGPIAPPSASPAAAAPPIIPTDLKPRPLGPNRSAPAPIAGAADVAKSAPTAGTLWDNSLVRTTASLLVVLTLIVVLAAVTKKIAGKSGSLAAAMGPGGKAPAGLLEVLGRYPLCRGQTLILLKVDQRVLLLSQTTPRMRGGVGALTTLCEITDAEEVASILMKAGDHEGSGASAKFSALLHAFDTTHGDEDHTEVDLRSVRQNEAGDRAELWNERATAPVVHKFPMPTMAAMPTMPSPTVQQMRGAEAHAQSQQAAAPQGDSFVAIRQRLQALRGEAHR